MFRKFGVVAGCVNTADLDETRHQHNESNSHQQHSPPVSLNSRKYKTCQRVDVFFIGNLSAFLIYQTGLLQTLTTIQSAMFSYSSGFKNAFFSLASGPSASTSRHFLKTSQYPLKSLQGEPGCSVFTSLLKNLAHLSEPVLLQVLASSG